MTDPANGAMGKQAFARDWAGRLVVVRSSDAVGRRRRRCFETEAGARSRGSRAPGLGEQPGSCSPDVLRIAEGKIVEIVTFDGSLFDALGVPSRYPEGSGGAGTTTVPASMS
jgi:hypothetical protein